MAWVTAGEHPSKMMQQMARQGSFNGDLPEGSTFLRTVSWAPSPQWSPEMHPGIVPMMPLLSINAPTPEQVSSLLSDIDEVAEEAAKAIADYCDVFRVDPTMIQEHRFEVGRLEHIWDNLAGLMQKSAKQPRTNSALWAATAVGLVAFRIPENIKAVSTNKTLLLALAKLMRVGTMDEKSAAAGAICNVCADGTDQVEIARTQPLIDALVELCKMDGDVRLRAVGSFTNVSCGDASREALLQNSNVCEVLESILTIRGSGDAHEVLLARATMSLANLTGRNEGFTFVADFDVIKTIILCLDCAIESLLSDEPKTHGGVVWTISIVLYPIYQLSIADTNKLSLVEAGCIVQLLRILARWRVGTGTRELEWTLLTLLQLCFDDDCRGTLAVNLRCPEEVKACDDALGKLPPPDALAALDTIITIDPPSELERTRDTGGSLGLLAAILKEQVDDQAKRTVSDAPPSDGQGGGGQVGHDQLQLGCAGGGKGGVFLPSGPRVRRVDGHPRRLHGWRHVGGDGGRGRQRGCCACVCDDEV